MGGDRCVIGNRCLAVDARPNQMETERVGSDDVHLICPGWKVLGEGPAEAARGNAKDRVVTERSPSFELTDPCLRATHPNQRPGDSHRENDKGSDTRQITHNSTGRAS